MCKSNSCKDVARPSSKSRFNQRAMLTHFAAPADRPPPYEQRFESFDDPPCLMCTEAFWGFNCYNYMKEQLVTKLNAGGKRSCSHEFRAFREFGFKPAIVFSDGTKPTQSSLINISAPGQCWWPVLAANEYSQTSSGICIVNMNVNVCGPPGCSWLLLARPGSSWAPPGSSWLLLAPPGFP